MRHSFIVPLDGMNVAFPFSARIARCGWILLDPPCGGAIGQLSPFLSGEFPQSLYSFDDVRDGDGEHDDGDRTVMAMEGWWHRKRRENACQYYRGSIRVGQKVLWFVRGAHKKTPRQHQAHGAGQHELHKCGARTVTYASVHIGVSIRAGRTTQCFDRFIPLLRGWAKQERRFLSRPCFSVMPKNKSNHAFLWFLDQPGAT
jgi:hypothetical protein